MLGLVACFHNHSTEWDSKFESHSGQLGEQKAGDAAKCWGATEFDTTTEKHEDQIYADFNHPNILKSIFSYMLHLFNLSHYMYYA